MVRIILSILLALSCFAQPSVNTDGVLNSASYQPAGLPGSGIAQGSLFLVFGTGLGPAALQQSAYPLPRELAGTSIRVTVGGTSVDALMVYTLATQAAAVLPSSTPTGAGTLTVTFNGQTSASAPIRVVRSAFGIYTLNQGGSGPAVITDTSFRPTTLMASARPGDTLIVWGTGLGPVSGDEASPPVPSNQTERDVRVLVGGRAAAVSYRGRSGCCSGLDQIAFEVPPGIEGCYVPVTVIVDGVPGNYGSLSIARDGGVCSDPAGIPQSALARLATSGGNLRVGFIELRRISTDITLLGVAVPFKQDRGAADFYTFDARSIIASRSLSAVSAFGTCTVQVCRSAACIPNEDALSAGKLDAGAAISINGPRGIKAIPRVRAGEYRADIGGGSLPIIGGGMPDYLDPGAYTATGAGGTDVGAFTAALTAGEARIWQNKSEVRTPVSRARDLVVRWNPGSNDEYVAVFGTSTAASTPPASATFICTERASAGTLTVPAAVLSALPPSGTLSQAGFTVPAGAILVGNYRLSNPFTAPGLDLGFFNHAVTDGKNLGFE